MFQISASKGFHITFINGYTVSVQFGRGNYSDNYNFEGSYDGPVPASRTAEVAAWDNEGNWFPLGDDEEIAGYMTANEVLEIMNKVAAI